MPNPIARLSFLDRPCIEHRVGTQTLKFYPASLRVTFELRNRAKVIGQALAVLFDSDDHDYGTISRSFTDGSEITVQPKTPEIINSRLANRQKAIGDIIDSLMSEDGKDAIGRLIMDSLHQLFPADDQTNPPPIEFFNNLKLPDLVEFLTGVAKANKGMFGPLGERVGTLLNKVTAAVTTIAEKSGDEIIGTAKSTLGSNSKINSSGSSSEATPSPASSDSPSISSPASTSPASA